MAVRSRKFFVLDLSAIRKVSDPVVPSNGVARRTFLAGAAGAAFAAGPGKSLAAGLAAGALRVKKKAGKNGRLKSVSIYVDAEHAWTIDTSIYDGNPILSIDESGREMVLSLEGALLPGTRFAINLEARITQGLLDRKAVFAFRKTGVAPADFEMSAPFDAWVRGEAEAGCPVSTSLFESREGLQDEVSLKGGIGKVSYRPDGGFAFAGDSQIAFADRKLGLTKLSLFPESAERSPLVEGGAQTRLTAARDGAWAGRFGFEAQGWKTAGTLGTFDRVEAILPSLAAALVTLDHEGRSGTLIESEVGTCLKLHRTRLSTFVQPENRTELLAGKLEETGAWLSFRGASLEVGPLGDDAEALFASIETPEGTTHHADIQAGIRNAAFDLDGAVTRTRISDVEPISLAAWEDVQGGATQIRPGGLQRGNVVVPPAPASQANLQVSRLDLTAVTTFRLVPFRLDVFRREDMLALSFEFVNLSFASGAATPTLQRSDASKPAYIVVNFPPQALAEAHFFEDATGAPQLSSRSGPAARPIRSRLSGESKLVFWIPTAVQSVLFTLKGDDGKGRNGLLDWAKWRPSITATAVQTYGSPKIRIESAFINPIDSITVKRSAALKGAPILRPPGEEEEADLGFDGSMRKLAARRGPSAQGNTQPLLQRGNITPLIQSQPKANVNNQLGKLVTNLDPTLTFRFIPKARMEPNALHTQIEMPVRVILSPHENAGWMHTAALPTNPPSGKFALWHTRLGHKVDPTTAGGEHTLYMYADDGRSFYRVSPSKTEGPFFVSTRQGPTVRVIDAVDYVSPKPTSGANNPNPIIAETNSGMWRIEYPMKLKDRCELVDSMCYRGERTDDSEPFEVENLILSPLGGYLKGEWNWRAPSGWKLASPELITWRHVSTLGRDHYMKLVRIGYLFPTGHKAAMVTISERKFQTTTEGKVVAYVRTREYVIVRDPQITLSGSEVNALGFSSLTLLTQETPVLDIPIPATSTFPAPGLQNNGVLKWLYSGGQPVMFKVKAVDQDGRDVQWSMPMIFVWQSTNINDTARLDALIAAYNDEKKTLPASQRRANLFGQMVAFAPGGGKGPGNQDAEGNTSYPCKNLLVSAVVSRRGAPASYIQDQARWTPVLHTANISAPAVQMMQGKPPALGAIHLPGESFDMDALQASTEAAALMYEDADGFDVKIPDVFKQNGFGGGNKAQMFLELLEKVGPEFGDTSKTGGIANPNMLIQGLAKGKGPIGGALNDILNGNVNPKDLLDQGARLLGAVKIFDILPNPIKIDPGGTDAPYIELLLIYDDGKNKPPTGATVSVKWKPPLQNWGFPSSPPLFYVNNFKSDPAGIPFGGAKGELLLDGSITTKFKGGEKPKMKFVGSMKNFRVDLISPASFLIIDFEKIEFIAEVGKPFDVNVDMKKMTFTGPLTFVQKLQDLVNGDDGMNVSIDPYSAVPMKSSALSTSADPGLDVYLDVDETGIRAGLTLTVPTINCGMLAIKNISLGVKLTLPFFGDPLSVRFNFCERNNTFQLSYMGVTGGGFVALELNIDGDMIFEAAFEVGGSLSFDIGVASGGVSIMAGIYFRLENKDCMLEAYIRINGNLSVLGLIRINLEFYLSLTYYSDGNRLVGTASVTIEIEILFFSVSVTATVQRTLTGEKSGSVWYASNELPMADQTVKFSEAVSQTQWVEFCAAYA